MVPCAPALFLFFCQASQSFSRPGVRSTWFTIQHPHSGFFLVFVLHKTNPKIHSFGGSRMLRGHLDHLATGPLAAFCNFYSRTVEIQGKLPADGQAFSPTTAGSAGRLCVAGCTEVARASAATTTSSEARGLQRWQGLAAGCWWMILLVETTS